MVRGVERDPGEPGPAKERAFKRPEVKESKFCWKVKGDMPTGFKSQNGRGWNEQQMGMLLFEKCHGG